MNNEQEEIKRIGANKPGRFDVFLSHCHDDADIVEELATKLEDKANLRVWLDKWTLIPGEHWQQEMAKSLSKVKTCAICIGSDTPTGWFKEEIEKALNRQTKDKSFRVIPILLPGAQETNIVDFLELRTWADLKNGINDEKNFHILVSGILGVPPGRFRTEENSNSPNSKVREKLIEIKTLHDEMLISEDIAKEFQRKLVEKIIEI